MANGMTRRETLRRGAAAAARWRLPEWALPALAQGEVDVPFTDVPATFNSSAARRRTTASSTCARSTASSRRPISSSSSSTTTSPRSTRPTLPAEGDRPGREADRAVARRSAGDARGRHRQRLRVLRQQPARDAGAVVERPLHRRPAARRAAARRRRRQGARGGVLRRRQGATRTSSSARRRFKMQQQFARSITLENAMKPEPMLA